MKTENKLEVGQRLEIDGRVFWIARILDERNELELMPDPDNKPFQPSQAHRLPGEEKEKSGFWPTFWVILLIFILIKLFI